MKVLGIESTCDETAASVVVDGTEILSNVIESQEKLHAVYGGVIPELASQRHIEIIDHVIQKAIDQASITFEKIDLIAVAQGPGLIGPLLVGMHAAKGLAMALHKPLVGINHVEAHLWSAVMGAPEKIKYPALGLIISGGHTALVAIQAPGQYKLLGTTIDDAIGEAFDKVGVLMDLTYPSGPRVEALAKKGDPSSFSFRPGHIKGRPLDFSFSGLKTQVLYSLKGQSANKHSPLILGKEKLADVAASFQRAALGDIIDKTRLALGASSYKSLLIGGGVSANQRLKDLFETQDLKIPILWPPRDLMTDNAAMIAGLAYPKSQNQVLDFNLDLRPLPGLQAFAP